MTVTQPIVIPYAPNLAPLPDAAALRAWLTITATAPPADASALLDQACIDAADYQLGRLDYALLRNDGADPPNTVPANVAQAVLMDAARLYRRRNSVNGYDGYDDLGTVPIRGNDADIERLVDRWRAWAWA